MTKNLKLNNKIVRKCDPEYDFIFNHKINGLITASA